MSSVCIFESNNIVFAEVTSRLNLYDLQLDGGWVSQSVYFTKRNIGGLIFGEEKNLIAVGDFGRAFDDDPVLGPVVMHLEAEFGAGIDVDTFDFEALAEVD